MDAATLTLAHLDATDPHCTGHGKRNRLYWCPLPACAHRAGVKSHRSCSVDTETGLWNCHRCNASGKLKEFWTERPDDRFKDRGKRSRSVPRAPKLPTVAPLPEPPPVDEQEWRSALVGLGPLRGSAGVAYLQARGLTVEPAIAAGVKFMARFYGRPALVFPIRTPSGELVAVQGRHTDGRSDPKAHGAGPKSSGVFATAGAWSAARLVIAEAPLDALTLAEIGLASVATLGCVLPAWMPRACHGREVLIATDADEAGDTAAAAWKNVLEAFGAVTKRLRPEGAKDWNELHQADPGALRRQVLEYLPEVVFAPECEELFNSTLRDCGEFYSAADMDLEPEALEARRALEFAMNEALAVGDLSRLKNACGAYVETALSANRSQRNRGGK